MKLTLKSDFHDYYDAFFDRGAPTVFERMTTGGMSRREMLAFLSHRGLKPPNHGLISELEIEAGKKYVVYRDEHSHRGEGKELVDGARMLDGSWHEWDELYASEYLEGPPVSLRMLMIGYRSWYLEYKSDDAWRSNVGDVQIKIVSESLGYNPGFNYPLYAIDFVRDKDGNQHAVDFNVAPGVGWTGIEDTLKGHEVVELIKSHYTRKAKR